MKKKKIAILLSSLMSTRPYASFMMVDIPKTQPAPAAAAKGREAFVLSSYDRVP